MAMSRSLARRSLTTRGPMAISPPLISSSPAIMRRSVDLPQPEGPTSTTNSPSSISTDTPRRTLTLPYFLIALRMDTDAILISILFNGTRCQTGDDLALCEDGEKENRQRDHQGCGGKRAPADLLEGQHVIDRDRQGACLAACENDAENEIVPREDHRKDERNHNARLGDGQRHLHEYLP